MNKYLSIVIGIVLGFVVLIIAYTLASPVPAAGKPTATTDKAQ